MRFQSRNVYYLRLSSNAVIPLYLYLDERHIEWMTEYTLQCVLTDLRPFIVPKLQVEVLGQTIASSKQKGTVEVHRGDSYQFAYFFRKTEPHSVLIKSRDFTTILPDTSNSLTARPPAKTERPRILPRGKSKKRKPTSDSSTTPKAAANSRKRQKTKGKAKAVVISSEEETLSISDNTDSNDEDVVEVIPEGPPRRSGCVRTRIANAYNEDSENSDHITPPEPKDQQELSTAEDVDMTEESRVKEEEEEVVELPAPSAQVTPDPDTNPTVSLALDDEEEPKPKPTLNLKYRGFNITGNCLCVVVEPWPEIRAQTREQSTAPIFASLRRGATPVPTSQNHENSQMPLFLPDLGEDDQAVSESSVRPSLRNRPPVPLFNDPPPSADDDDDDTDLMDFSQALNKAAEGRQGVPDEDDEMDGALLFGDADENREL